MACVMKELKKENVTRCSHCLVFIYVLAICIAQKMKFFIKKFFSKCEQNPQETANLVTFTEEIFNAKLDVLCSVDLVMRNPKLLSFKLCLLVVNATVY